MSHWDVLFRHFGETLTIFQLLGRKVDKGAAPVDDGKAGDLDSCWDCFKGFGNSMEQHPSDLNHFRTRTRCR